jgi:DNA-binding HxlR family transcriptional regulator
MLTMTLRKLERDGMLARHVFPEVPPRVEYELTALGESFLPAMRAFVEWIDGHSAAIVESRRRAGERAVPSRTATSRQF